jgi:hypothetical protein
MSSLTSAAVVVKRTLRDCMHAALARAMGRWLLPVPGEDHNLPRHLELKRRYRLWPQSKWTRVLLASPQWQRLVHTMPELTPPRQSFREPWLLGDQETDPQWGRQDEQ